MANPWKQNMSQRVTRPSAIARGAGPVAPPQIDIMAEVRETARRETLTAKPAWETKATPKQSSVIIPGKIHFGKAGDVKSGSHKTAMQLAQERKREKREAEEATKRAAIEKEKNKHAHLPEWKRAMMEKKEAAAKKESAPMAAIARRRDEVEHMFDDLPGFMKEKKIKQEKRRILQEEGVNLDQGT